MTFLPMRFHCVTPATMVASGMAESVALLASSAAYRSRFGTLNGADWLQIAEWVGHVNQTTTQLCTHFNTAESEKRMEAMEIRF